MNDACKMILNNGAFLVDRNAPKCRWNIIFFYPHEMFRSLRIPVCMPLFVWIFVKGYQNPS